ncbi:MAG: hypothetical protein ACRC8S_20595 [Fimbriiglobus sp.]
MAKGKVVGTISKRKMVEEALANVGDVGPQELHQYIMDKYKVNIGYQMISSYKSNLKKANGGTTTAIGNYSVGIRDLATLQDLIARNGKDQIIALAKMLSKSSTAPAAE